MARTAPLVEISERSLRRFRRNLDRLGTQVIPSAGRDAAEKAGHEALLLLRIAFRRHIAGGPAPATRVLPDSPSSSVKAVYKPTKGDEVSVDLEVNRKVARWMQFQLEDRKLRTPGEVGVAKAWNWIPQKSIKSLAGIRLPHGNLPIGTLGRLVARSEAETASPKGVFYRQRNGRKSAGFFIRRGPDSAPRMLVAQASKSRYRGNLALHRAWNTSVERAGGRMSAEAARAIMRDVGKMQT